MFTVNRQYWIETAQKHYELAQEGSINRKKKKSKRSILRTSVVEKMPNLHRESDISFYISSAQAFRIASRWVDAANSYESAACIFLNELKSPSKAASLFFEAGICKRMIEKTRGFEYFRKASDIYCNLEDYRKAAYVYLTIAQSLKDGENESDVEEMRDTFLIASKFFRAANMDRQSIECTSNAAFISAKNNDYLQSSKLYEEVAIENLKFNLTKYSCHRYFFRAALLLLANEPASLDGVKRFIHRAASIDQRFKSSPHHLFLHNILSIFHSISPDRDTFADHLFYFNEVSRIEFLDLELLRVIYKSKFDRKE
jgi:tetratricopeptide (TPR) repeat protein